MQPDQLGSPPEETVSDSYFLGFAQDEYFLGPVEVVVQSEADAYNAWWLVEFIANPNYAPEYVVPYVSFEYVEPEIDIVQQMQETIFDF